MFLVFAIPFVYTQWLPLVYVGTLTSLAVELESAETAWHNRVTGKVAAKKPQVGVYIQLGDDFALVVLATFRTDVDDTVQHEHVVGG